MRLPARPPAHSAEPSHVGPRPTRRAVLAQTRGMYPDRLITRHSPIVAVEYQRAMMAWRASGGR